MALDGAVLEIDFYDGSTTQTAVFEMRGNIQIDEGVRPNYLVEDFGEKVIAITGTIAGSIGIDNTQTRRRSYTIDVGAGEHTFDIQFLGWTGSNHQWGDGQGGAFDATNEDALKQIAVLNQVLTRGTTDSLNPARLYVGEYTDGTYGTSGKFSSEAPLNVQVDGISGNVTAEETKNQFNGNLSLTETAILNEAIDKVSKLEF